MLDILDKFKAFHVLTGDAPKKLLVSALDEWEINSFFARFPERIPGDLCAVFLRDGVRGVVRSLGGKLYGVRVKFGVKETDIK